MINFNVLKNDGHAKNDNRLVGKPVIRVEDEALIQGKGHYVADIHLPGMVHAAFVRSPHAHAKIIEIDVKEAEQTEGVIGAYTRDNATELLPLPLLVPHPALKPAMPQPFTDGIVRYAGEAIAVVVAEDQYAAEDGVNAVNVVYESIKAVTDARTVNDPRIPAIHETIGTNLAAHIVQKIGDTDAVMRTAPVVVSEKLYFGRGQASSMETRGIVADYRDNNLTIWASTQAPHNLRRAICSSLNLPEDQVRVITPDVGGGFGPKAIAYVEDIVVAWLAMKLKTPVKWIEDRKEHFFSTTHEREQYHEAKIALDNDGQILAVEDTFWADQGAYVPWGIIVPYLTSTTVPGPYKIPNFKCDGYVVYTNKTPVAPYRGAGRPAGITIMERLMDRAAEKLNMDPAEIRLRNFIKKEEFPYKVGLIYRDGSPLTYDSGDYITALQKGLDAINYESFKKSQQDLFNEGKYIGIGISGYVEGTGLGPFEGASVKINNNGHAVVHTGAPAQGQGHKTTFAQIVADELGLPMSHIEVNEGDTDKIARGIGTFASRAAAVCGTSVLQASQKVRAQVLSVAAGTLGVEADSLVLQEGVVFDRNNPAKQLTFKEIHALANYPAPGSTQRQGVAPGLEAIEYFQPKQATYSNGFHLVKVEVDPDLGSLKFLDYVIVHDCGNVLNPLLADGQVQGGLAHGISGALYEELVYDETGQLLTGSYMDYLMPCANEVPDARIIHHEVPTPLNPLGVKGAGEGGTIPAMAAIGAAVEDALKPFGVKVSEFPISPNRLYHAIKRGKRNE